MTRLVKRLEERGAIVNVRILPTRPLIELRKANGLPPVGPSAFPALIDPGSARSAVDSYVLEKVLDLSPFDFVEVRPPSSSRRRERRGLYEVSLAFIEPEIVVVSEAMTVVGCDGLIGSRCGMLIGRDVLDRCEFLYDGPRGEFTLTV